MEDRINLLTEDGEVMLMKVDEFLDRKSHKKSDSLCYHNMQATVTEYKAHIDNLIDDFVRLNSKSKRIYKYTTASKFKQFNTIHQKLIDASYELAAVLDINDQVKKEQALVEESLVILAKNVRDCNQSQEPCIDALKNNANKLKDLQRVVDYVTAIQDQLPYNRKCEVIGNNYRKMNFWSSDMLEKIINLKTIINQVIAKKTEQEKVNDKSTTKQIIAVVHKSCLHIDTHVSLWALLAILIVLSCIFANFKLIVRPRIVYHDMPSIMWENIGLRPI